jgi:hypothetical protein
MATERISSDVPPCLAVDSCPGGHVADVEFGGQLPVSQSFGPAGAQFPYSLVGQRGPGVALADGAVMVAVAFAAPGLESGSDIAAGWIDRRPVFSRFTAINTGVTAGWAKGFVDALVPYVIGGVCGLAGDTSELVSARAGAASVVAPDYG